MKEFRTELIPAISASSIGLKDRIFTIGSCFADSIGGRLVENKFKVWNNRLGTVYNPISIHRLLSFGLKDELPVSESYLKNEDVNFNFHFHSSFSALRKEELENRIKDSVVEANQFLKSATTIVVTYGTAFVYKLKSNNEIVANCHKIPSANFFKSLLTESEVVKSFSNFYSTLKTINPECKIILTISPVRHLKDTLELNSVSKSILRLSCHLVKAQFPEVEYFPAYEILLDDLRDYRFYKVDRLHPTDEAVEYIWEKFIDSYVDEQTKKFVSEWQRIKKDMSHEPFHLQSEKHQKFLKSILSKLEKLNPTVDVSNEIQNVKRKIQN